MKFDDDKTNLNDNKVIKDLLGFTICKSIEEISAKDWAIITDLKLSETAKLDSKRGGLTLKSYLSFWPSKGHLFLIAKVDASVVGFVEFVNVENVVSLLYIIVTPNYRRQRIATKMYRYLENNIDKLVISGQSRQDDDYKLRIECYSLAGDLASKSLFESIGAKGGLIVMSKLLN